MGRTNRDLLSARCADRTYDHILCAMGSALGLGHFLSLHQVPKLLS